MIYYSSFMVRLEQLFFVYKLKQEMGDVAAVGKEQNPHQAFLNGPRKLQLRCSIQKV